jgi:hypothetical protein
MNSLPCAWCRGPILATVYPHTTCSWHCSDRARPNVVPGTRGECVVCMAPSVVIVTGAMTGTVSRPLCASHDAKHGEG